MPPRDTPPPAHTEPVDPDADTSGFDWHRYKNDRRELHEKLLRDQEEPEPPTEPAPEK